MITFLLGIILTIVASVLLFYFWRQTWFVLSRATVLIGLAIVLTILFGVCLWLGWTVLTSLWSGVDWFHENIYLKWWGPLLVMGMLIFFKIYQSDNPLWFLKKKKENEYEEANKKSNENSVFKKRKFMRFLLKMFWVVLAVFLVLVVTIVIYFLIH